MFYRHYPVRNPIEKWSKPIHLPQRRRSSWSSWAHPRSAPRLLRLSLSPPPPGAFSTLCRTWRWAVVKGHWSYLQYIYDTYIYHIYIMYIHVSYICIIYICIIYMYHIYVSNICVIYIYIIYTYHIILYMCACIFCLTSSRIHRIGCWVIHMHIPFHWQSHGEAPGATENRVPSHGEFYRKPRQPEGTPAFFH